MTLTYMASLWGLANLSYNVVKFAAMLRIIVFTIANFTELSARIDRALICWYHLARDLLRVKKAKCASGVDKYKDLCADSLEYSGHVILKHCEIGRLTIHGSAELVNCKIVCLDVFGNVLLKKTDVKTAEYTGSMYMSNSNVDVLTINGRLRSYKSQVGKHYGDGCIVTVGSDIPGVQNDWPAKN